MLLVEKFSKTGEYHKRNVIRNQDQAAVFETDYYMMAVLADGASGCTRGGEGAEIACLALRQILENAPEVFFFYNDTWICQMVLLRIRDRIEEKLQDGEVLTDYGSTLSFWIMDKQSGEAVVFHLGDGAVFQFYDYGEECLFSPRKYGTDPCLTTTEGAEKACFVRKTDIAYGDTILMGTDGFFEGIRRGEKAILKEIRGRNFGQANGILSGLAMEDDASYIAVTRRL